MSASMTRTRRPCAAASSARFAVMLVLPTPPLPLVTAMTRRREAGLCAAASCRKPAA